MTEDEPEGLGEARECFCMDVRRRSDGRFVERVCASKPTLRWVRRSWNRFRISYQPRKKSVRFTAPKIAPRGDCP